LAITKERKEALVAEYTDMLSRSQAIILTEFRGMPDKEFKAIRKAVREANGIFRVVKTSLLLRALEAAGLPVPGDLWGVPLAIGFCFDNVSGVAKAMTQYAKDSEALAIRVGLMGQQVLNPDDLKAIASLPPIEVLRAQIVGLLDAPASNLVGVIQAGIGQVINVINAYAEQEQAAPA